MNGNMESGLRRVSYVDLDGRKRVSLLPHGVGDEEAESGIPIGPPRLEELELPKDIEVRLNNELYHRGIITPQDAVRGRGEIVAALNAVFKIDANRIIEVYVGKEQQNA